MGDDRKMGHVQSMKTYVGVFIALLILTIITYAAAGKFHNPLVSNIVAVGIAAVKASLVTWFFMHGRFESKETWAFVWYPVVLLGLLLGGLFLDYANRPDGIRTIDARIAKKKGYGDEAKDLNQVPAESTSTDSTPAEGDAPAEGDDAAPAEGSQDGDAAAEASNDEPAEGGDQ